MVAVLNTLSTGERRGKETRDATMAAMEPAMRPAIIISPLTGTHNRGIKLGV